MLLQGKAPLTWVDFKRVFAANWLASTFEVDVMTQWHKLNSNDYMNLDDYTKKLRDALLPIESYRLVTLKEQVKMYYCELPKHLRDYCTKTRLLI